MGRQSLFEECAEDAESVEDVISCKERHPVGMELVDRELAKVYSEKQTDLVKQIIGNQKSVDTLAKRILNQREEYKKELEGSDYPMDIYYIENMLEEEDVDTPLYTRIRGTIKGPIHRNVARNIELLKEMKDKLSLPDKSKE